MRGYIYSHFFLVGEIALHFVFAFAFAFVIGARTFFLLIDQVTGIRSVLDLVSLLFGFPPPNACVSSMNKSSSSQLEQRNILGDLNSIISKVLDMLEKHKTDQKKPIATMLTMCQPILSTNSIQNHQLDLRIAMKLLERCLLTAFHNVPPPFVSYAHEKKNGPPHYSKQCRIAEDFLGDLSQSEIPLVQISSAFIMKSFSDLKRLSETCSNQKEQTEWFELWAVLRNSLIWNVYKKQELMVKEWEKYDVATKEKLTSKKNFIFKEGKAIYAMVCKHICK